MVLSSSSGSPLELRPAASDQVAVGIAQENEAAFGARQAQRRVDQRDQDFVEHADRIELARSFQEQRQLFEIAGLGRDLNAGNLAEEFARGVRSRVQRMKNQVRDVARAELQSIVARQFAAIDAFAVDEGSMLAALVDDKEFAVLGHDVGMLARDPRIGNHQIAVHLAADGVRSVIQRQRLLLVPLDVDHDRENTRHCTRWRNRRNRHETPKSPAAKPAVGPSRKHFTTVKRSDGCR